MELADRSLWDRFLEAEGQGLRGIPRAELLGYLVAVADAIDYLNDSRHTIAGRRASGDPAPRPEAAEHPARRRPGQGRRLRPGPGHGAVRRQPHRPLHAPLRGPRVLRRDGPPDQSDQYSLAVTYCHLRGGGIPFPGTTAQIMSGTSATARPGGPARARAADRAPALAKRPEDRWPDCRSFVDALKELGSAGEGTIPDVLPEESIGPLLRAERRGDLTTGPDPADTDFIPVRLLRFESPYGIEDSAETVPATCAGPTDSASSHGSGHGPSNTCRIWPFPARADGSRMAHRDRRRPSGAAGKAAVRQGWSARPEPVGHSRRRDRIACGRSAVARRTRPDRGRPGVAAHRFHRRPAVSGLVLGISSGPPRPSRAPREPSDGLTTAENGTPPIDGRHGEPLARGRHRPSARLEPPRVAGQAEAPRSRGFPRCRRGRPGPRWIRPGRRRSRPRRRAWRPSQQRSHPRRRAWRPDRRSRRPRLRPWPQGRPGAPAGTNPIGSGLESALAWLQRLGPIRTASTKAAPAPHRAEANKGSVGPPPPERSDRDAGRRPSDDPVAPKVVAPSSPCPAR